MALASLGRERQLHIIPVSSLSTAGGAQIISPGSLKPEAGLYLPYFSQEEKGKLHLQQEASSGWKTYEERQFCTVPS